MPLVKSGQIAEDRYVRVLDDAPLPDDVPVHLDGAAVPRRRGRDLATCSAVGVLWPNDRQVAELAPCIDRLSLIALVFPKFKDGRAYSQARLLRERSASAANCAPPATCCATSSSSCCAPASTRSR